MYESCLFLVGCRMHSAHHRVGALSVVVERRRKSQGVQWNYSHHCSPFFLPLESQQHDLPRNLLKTFALGKLCQLFCDIVPVSLAPNLGKHFPQTDPPSFIPENTVSQDELKVLEQTKNQLCQIVTIRSPPRLWCPCHLSDITKNSLKFKGTKNIFVQWRQKPWYLRC